MEKYIQQLLSDIDFAMKNVSWPYPEKELQLWDWTPDDEEEQAAPVRELEEWTGIRKEMLPSGTLLEDEQIHQLLEALKKMLDEYNWSFVMQIQVPERIQYETIRENFDQLARVKRWHPGFFEVCKKGAKQYECVLGEYCHCGLFAEMFKDMIDEQLTPEEERARALEIEVEHIQRKYGDEWMKYYPYHLDKNYDDENGNPYNYGFGDFDEDDDEDNWWRR